MEDLEEKFNKTIKDANFELLEMAGFRSDPELSLRAGMAMGYQVACDDIKDKRDALSF